MTKQSSSGDSSLLKTRLELYGVYGSEAALQQDLERFQVEPMVKSGQTNGTDDEDEYFSTQPSNNGTAKDTTPNDSATSSAPTTNSVSTRQQTSSDRDIWGRFPLKEAKEFIPCPVCGRANSTLRLAAHLDKCMGIGTTVRSAAGALGTTTKRSAANQN